MEGRGILPDVGDTAGTSKQSRGAITVRSSGIAPPFLLQTRVQGRPIEQQPGDELRKSLSVKARAGWRRGVWGGCSWS